MLSKSGMLEFVVQKFASDATLTIISFNRLNNKTGFFEQCKVRFLPKKEIKIIF